MKIFELTDYKKLARVLKYYVYSKAERKKFAAQTEKFKQIADKLYDTNPKRKAKRTPKKAR